MSLLKSVFSPLFLVLASFMMGWLLLVLNKRKILAKILLGIGLTCLFFLSFRPFSNFLVWKLESKYSPFKNFNNINNINYIVVLTDWCNDNSNLPYTSNLGYKSSARVLEAHRIWMLLPKCKIIISGDEVSSELMSMLMLLLGVQRENIIIDDKAANTWESARNIKNLLGREPFILVTSAIHLPRTMISFSKLGIKPIPAPADFSYGYYKKFQVTCGRSLEYYIPNVSSLMKSNLALYEYLGICWYIISHRVKVDE